MAERTGIVVIGAGQAGIAMSRHLAARAMPHIVLERDRIVEAWRSRRWDSLVANGPAWHDRFPDAGFEDVGPDGFAPKDSVVRYFERYAAARAGEIRERTEVRAVRRDVAGFRVETDTGEIAAEAVVVATGPFQHPAIPPLIPEGAGPHQIHSADYRRPDDLPEGGVLVVGAGSSGAQIADELLSSGRDVTLAIGPHDRPPRRYRGHDFVWWLGALGKWQSTEPPDDGHVTIAVSGAHGGATVDFRKMAARGMRLVGRAERFEDGRLHFAPDLARNIRAGDANYLSVLYEADAHVAATGLNLPPDPQAREIGPDPVWMSDPVGALDLAQEGVGTVIWATGYRTDFSWIDAPAFDARGKPVHDRGVSRVPGLYFLGLPFLSCRGSAFIWGVWPDAEYLAEHIAGSRTSPS